MPKLDFGERVGGKENISIMERRNPNNADRVGSRPRQCGRFTYVGERARASEAIVHRLLSVYNRNRSLVLWIFRMEEQIFFITARCFASVLACVLLLRAAW